MDKLNATASKDGDENFQYDITAVIKVVCTLDSKVLGEYKNAVASISDFNGYMTVLKSFIPKYSWTYYNGAGNTEATKKEATEIFGIRFIGAEKTHFLVENVKNIVTTHPYVAKSRARKVLCITYTNAAVDEIVRRLDRYIDSVEIHTIHGFIIEHIIKPFQQDLREIISEEFGITVDGKGKITSQVEGLGILHGVDKAEIFKYITDKTAETTELSCSKKNHGRCTSKNYRLSTKCRIVRRKES